MLDFDRRLYIVITDCILFGYAADGLLIPPSFVMVIVHNIFEKCDDPSVDTR